MHSEFPALACSRPDPPPPSAAGHDTAFDQNASLLRTIPIGVAGSVLPAAVLAWELHTQAPQLMLCAWFSALLLAHLGRLLVWLGAQRDAQAGLHAVQWLRRLRASALALGASWALLPLLPAAMTPFDELLIAAVVAAVCGAGVAQQSADAWSALLFTIPPATACCVRLFVSGTPVLQPVGMLALLYFGFLVLAARRIEGTFVELSRLHARAAHQSLHDALTGLPNRLALNLHLDEALARAKRSGTLVAVGYIDLDGFKQVNDDHGHDAGDSLLRELARRWGEQLRGGELIGRLGGDEFVIVIEDIDPARATAQLGAVFERLHAATVAPVHLNAQAEAQVGVTLGVARFPLDGSDADTLLRQADAAMYQLKQRKATRRSWWQIGVGDGAEEPPQLALQPYGAEAAVLLGEHAAWLARLNADFAAGLCAGLHDEAAPSSARHLDAAQRADLAQRQRAYLDTVVDPRTGRDALQRAARAIGVIHALGGVSGSVLARAAVQYRTMLAERISALRLPPSRRTALLQLLEARLRDELQAQFAAGEEVTQAYLGAFSRPHPPAGARWPEALRRELDAIGALPGIIAATLLRPDRNGTLVLERCACAGNLAEALFGEGAAPEIDAASPRGHGPIAHAWRSRQIQRVDDWTRDPRVDPWREAGAGLGIRSEVAIPFGARDAQVIGVLGLFGAQRAQFAAPWMPPWLEGLQNRFESIWAQCGGTAIDAAVAERDARTYRRQLFGGGLETVVQPIIELRSCRVHRVAALARLRGDDGRQLESERFLPVLGDAELDRVFRLQLEQAARALSDWDARGLQLELTIALPAPSLLDVDCAPWIGDLLRRHAIAPSRVTLELVPDAEAEVDAQGVALARLRAQGLRLAADVGAVAGVIDRLPASRFDCIKVDRRLIGRLGSSPLQTVALLGSLVPLGADFGHEVVVDGVADRGMLEVVAAFGADQAQGCAIAPPMPAAQLPDWLAGFRAPVCGEPAPLRTFAGALAYHWHQMHANDGLHAGALADCPLDTFLAARQLGAGEPGRWHARLHDSAAVHAEAAAAAQRLLAWLAARVGDDPARS